MYGNLQGADQHHQNAGNSEWLALDDDVKTANLNVASRVLDAMFEPEFIGTRAGGVNQQDAWPRIGPAVAAVGLENTIPNAVASATYEMANLVRLNPTLWTQVYAPGQMLKRKTTGPITKEFFAPGEGGDGLLGLPAVPLIRGWLYGLLKDPTTAKRRGLPVMVV